MNYTNVLKAFKEMDANGNGDPDDEIPLGGSWSEGYQESQIVLRAFGFTSRVWVWITLTGVENPSICLHPLRLLSIRNICPTCTSCYTEV